VQRECVTSSPHDLTIGDKGLTTPYCLAIAYWLACYAYAIQMGKGLPLLAFDSVLVFLPLSMGLDLDCCVPYPAPVPKEFHVFRGSGNLESLGKLGCGGSRNVLPRTGKYQL
jgi:hypothetical protein